MFDEFTLSDFSQSLRIVEDDAEGDPPPRPQSADAVAHVDAIIAARTLNRPVVDGEDDGPFRAGSPQIMVTLRVVGDDISDYLEIGSHFNLWLGSDIGRGIVTRRLHL